MGENYHVNYRFVVDQANQVCPGRGKLLDFGAGKGDIVQLALDNGWDAKGIEYFGAGSGTNIRNILSDRGFLGKRVLEYDGKTIPFETDSFDIVTSNQVFEHLPDLQTSLIEIARVLKPGGQLVFTFPYQDMWREGHLNVWFVHWMRPGSRMRREWLYLNRRLGHVRLKRNRPGRVWADFFDAWLDENTFYRSLREVEEALDTAGLTPHFTEADYLYFRARNRGCQPFAPQTRFGRAAAGWLSRGYAGLAGRATKRPASDP